MKRLMGLCLVLGMGSSLGACAYSGVAATADGKAIVARNDGLLFGLLRAVYVCNVTPAGLANCVAGTAP
jgi:hypothetical protein